MNSSVDSLAAHKALKVRDADIFTFSPERDMNHTSAGKATSRSWSDTRRMNAIGTCGDIKCPHGCPAPHSFSHSHRE